MNPDMFKTSVEGIIAQAKSNGDLKAEVWKFFVRHRLQTSFAKILVKNYRNGDCLTLGKEVYVYYEGQWYFGTRHPSNPFLPQAGTTSVVGYHLTDIKKEEYGSLEKIREELEEAIDAKNQGVKIMELVELADLVGAVEGYLEKEHPGTTLKDLIAMAKVTRRAFENGRRG